jgi:hypothetical protein
VETACDLLGIEITAARRGTIDALDGDGLAALLAQLRKDRRWGEGL